MLAGVFASAIAMPVLVGWRSSTAARWMIGAMVSQALAWSALLLARTVHDRLLSTLWIALLGLSLASIWHAVNAWIGRRPGRAIVEAALLLTPVGYGLGFASYAWRVGWSDTGLADFPVVL